MSRLNCPGAGRAARGMRAKSRETSSPLSSVGGLDNSPSPSMRPSSPRALGVSNDHVIHVSPHLVVEPHFVACFARRLRS